MDRCPDLCRETGHEVRQPADSEHTPTRSTLRGHGTNPTLARIEVLLNSISRQSGDTQLFRTVTLPLLQSPPQRCGNVPDMGLATQVLGNLDVTVSLHEVQNEVDEGTRLAHARRKFVVLPNVLVDK